MFDIEHYTEILVRMYNKLKTYNDICLKTSPEEDWSIIELVSHLIDSASNNHQRFIRLQYENPVVFPGYDAEIWRATSRTKDVDYLKLVELWNLYNWYLLEIVKRIEPSALNNCWIIDQKKLTLQFIVEDYYNHLVWHEKLFDEIEKRAREST
jgi:hypothetical protein